MKPTDPDHIRLLARPVEEDTRILAAKFSRVGGIPLLVEKWAWDGVTGMSAIFLTEHVAGMDDAALKNFLLEYGGADLSGGVTIARGETYTFLNFGFEAK